MSTQVPAILRAPRFTLHCPQWASSSKLELRLHLLEEICIIHKLESKRGPGQHFPGARVGALPEVQSTYTVGPGDLYTELTPAWPHERMERWLDGQGYDPLTASVLSHEFQEVMAPHSAQLMLIARAWHPDPIGWESRLLRAAHAMGWAFTPHKHVAEAPRW